MIKEKTLKKFKKLNPGDVMGVVRTLYPNVEITLTENESKKKT